MVKVKEFMDRMGFKTQEELAERLGLSQRTVSAWNKGHNGPTYATCIELLRMGMTVKELFGEDFPVSTETSHEDLKSEMKTALKTIMRIMGND
jgi:transcriptional regulator with XRE-family HTH domain